MSGQQQGGSGSQQGGQGGHQTQDQHGPDQATQQEIQQLPPDRRQKLEQWMRDNPGKSHREALDHVRSQRG